MSGARFIALMAVAVGVVAVLLGAVYFYQKGRTTQPKVATEQTEPPKPQGEAPATEAPPAKPTSVPSFDVVRIEPTGEGVIAGRAEPGWTVKIESGGAAVAETKADEEGAWSIVLDKPLGSGDHALTLKAISPDGTRALLSQQPVNVAVGRAEGQAVAQKEPPVAQEPAKEEASPASPGEQQATAEQPKPEQQADSSMSVESQPQPIVPDENHPPRERPEPPVKIKTLEYQDTGKDSGKIALSGVGDPNVRVFLFFDDEPLGQAMSGSDGTWAVEIEKKLEDGEHTVRADTYDEKTGMVAGRASVRLGREPAAAAPETAEQEPATPQPEASPAPPGPVAAVEQGQPSGQPEPVYPDGAPEPQTSSPEPSSSVAEAGPPSVAWQPQPVYPEEAPQAEAAQAEPANEQPAEPQAEAAPPAPSTPAVAAKQPSGAERPQSKTPPIAFKSVDYQDTSPNSGKVALAGTGEPGARILLFLDNGPLGQVSIGSGGAWAFEAEKKLENGAHKFRADRVDEGTGIVIGQASIDLIRMEPRKEAQAAAPAPAVPSSPPAAPAPRAGPKAAPSAAQAPSRPAPRAAAFEGAKPAATSGKQAHRKRQRPKVYTVRRGDTLWEIAESYYGGGWHYRAIVRDNRRKIHNPRLIYPKQKFHMPAH
jgi:LysM repeat protein